MTEYQLAELERLAKAATPGPWHRCLLDICKLDFEECCLNENAGGTCSDNVVSFIYKLNLEFIAAANAGARLQEKHVAKYLLRRSKE